MIATSPQGAAMMDRVRDMEWHEVRSERCSSKEN
jgi:hypothetical protein